MACSCCGDCGCQCGKLPYTMTVKFDGLEDKNHDKYCDLSFCSNFGFGAAGVAVGPGGCDGDSDRRCQNKETLEYLDSDRGEITGVLLTEQGSCYAKYGREPPALSISGGSGNGAEFSVSLRNNKNPQDGLDSWSIASISVSGGCGYADGDLITSEHSPDDTPVSKAFFRLRATASEPTVLARVSGSGRGAQITPTIKPVSWRVKSVVMKDHENTFGEGVGAGGAGVTSIIPFEAVALTKLDEPTLALSVAGGTGAALTATLSPTASILGIPAFQVSGITIQSGGTGYKRCAAITATPQDKSSGFYFSGRVSSVDANGAITGTVIDSPGSYFKDTQKVTSIVVLSGGEFQTKADPFQMPTLTAVSGNATGLAVEIEPAAWGVESLVIDSPGAGYTAQSPCKAGDRVVFSLSGSGCKKTLSPAVAVVSAVDEAGGIAAISVTSPGRYVAGGVPTETIVRYPGEYYRENKSLPPYVANVIVRPCGGKGKSSDEASIAATVGQNVNNDSFGKIVSLSLDDGGSDYLAWRWLKTNRSAINEKSFVLRANDPAELVQLRATACHGSGFCGRVVPMSTKRDEPCVSLIALGDPGFITNCKIVGEAITAQKAGDDGLPYWTIAEVSSASASGTCFAGGRPATVAFGGDTTVEVPPVVSFEVEPSGGVIGRVHEGGKFYKEYEYGGGTTPIKKVEVISPGSGYARLGREAPTLKIEKADGSLGSGVTFTPTLKAQKDSCGLDFWSIAGVTASGAGQCFGLTGRKEPKFSARSSPGFGAAFTVESAKAKDSCGAFYWSVSKVTVSCGSGYVNGSPVSIRSNGFAEVDAQVTLETLATAAENGEPQDSGVPVSTSVVDGGKYYIKGPTTEPLSVTLATSADKEEHKAAITLFANNGASTKIDVLDGGKYYRENKSLAPYVADVAITVEQSSGSTGSGAVIAPTVAIDTSKADFGSITALAIQNEGSGYTLLGSNPGNCTYSGACGIGLRFRGKNKEPEVTLGDGVYRAADKVVDCNKLPSSATVLHSTNGGSVTLSAGGAWNNQATCPCRGDFVLEYDPVTCDELPVCVPVSENPLP